MKRHAILLGNTAKTKNSKTSVNLTQLNGNLKYFNKTLTDLGEYSFSVDSICNKKRDESFNLIKKSIESFAKENSNKEHLLLFYYFGHGVERNNDLQLKFSDSDTKVPATMVSFKSIYDLVYDYNLKSAIFVLDCCHAGAANRQIININGSARKYFILASTVPLSYAHIKDGESPFGAFSLFFFQGLRTINASTQGTKNISINSLSKYISQSLSEDGFEQLPHVLDGGLGDITLAEAIPNRIIPNEFNKRAAKKSFYSKLWYIGNKVFDAKIITAKSLYKTIQVEQPSEFLTPVKKGGITVYEPIKEATFSNYLFKAKTLKIINDDNDIKLTTEGKKMFINNGAEFNSVLLQLIENELLNYEFSLEKMDILVRQKTTTRSIPTSGEIYFDAKRRYSLSIPSDWFTTLLDLSASSGYFKFSSQKTYFAY
jgi:hypothetical protein